MEKHDFKLIGLSRPSSATLEALSGNNDTYSASIDMPPATIHALFNLCRGDWNNQKIAEVECDRINDEGVPINARLVGIRYN